MCTNGAYLYKNKKRPFAAALLGISFWALPGAGREDQVPCFRPFNEHYWTLDLITVQAKDGGAVSIALPPRISHLKLRGGGWGGGTLVQIKKMAWLFCSARRPRDEGITLARETSGVVTG